MALPSGAALRPAERRVVASLAAIYAVRLLGLFLLLPVLALHAGEMPGGTPLLAGLAVGAYGLTQAIMQIPFGAWSDRIGRKPLIVVGLVLHVAGSALGAVAASAWSLVFARIVQGLGAVSGPVMALLADLTRPESRTRAMFAIGMSIGASFVISLVAGPLLAAAIGVSGVFVLIGGLGLLALALVLFALPAEPSMRERAVARRDWSQVLTPTLLPHYAGIFVLHLTLTAAFIAVPHALRDLHGIDVSRHWLFYLCVFAASVALTVPLMLWSERTRNSGKGRTRGRHRARDGLGGPGLGQGAFRRVCGCAGPLFRCLQLPRSAPARGTYRESRGGSPWRGARCVRDLPVRRGVCRRHPGRQLARKPLATHGNICLFGHRRLGLVAAGQRH